MDCDYQVQGQYDIPSQVRFRRNGQCRVHDSNYSGDILMDGDCIEDHIARGATIRDLLQLTRRPPPPAIPAR